MMGGPSNKAMRLVASRWKLRTQVSLVLFVLALLVTFLGAYALTHARRHASEVDVLLKTNVRANAVLHELETDHMASLKAKAKFAVTGDEEYRAAAEREASRVVQNFEALRLAATGDTLVESLVTDLYKLVGSRERFTKQVRKLERTLETERARKTENIRTAAHDLRSIIMIALIMVIAITSWLAAVFYLAILKPLDGIKGAVFRIREGDLSYRIDTVSGFQEMNTLRIEFNAMAMKLEELDKMKGDFLATVSHELKTPLTAVKEGLLFLAERRGSMPLHIQTRTLDVCINAAKRLEMMIQNLPNHAKLDTGFYSFDERPKSFIAAVEGAIQSLRPIAERRGIVIELNVETTHHWAAFSTEGISHAVENLIMNAIKYGDAAYPIVVEVRRIETIPVSFLELRVTNHGKGLLPSELTQVFERFFRAVNADGQQGVGLGLNLVKRIIEAHHGMLTVESNRGVTLFSFRIPQYHDHKTLLLPHLEVKV